MNSDCIFPDVIPEEKKPLEPPTELDENYEEEDRLVLVSVNFEKSLRGNDIVYGKRVFQIRFSKF